MLKIYYRIWADCISSLRRRAANKRNWKFKSIVMMSLAMTFNIALVMAIIQKYVWGQYFYKIDLPFLPKKIGNAASFFILFFIPSLILNLLMIFKDSRYENFIDRYPTYNGNLFVGYFLGSLALPIVLLWVYILFVQ
jgi:hypothetical protein